MNPIVEAGSYVLSIVGSTTVLQWLVGKLLVTRLHFSVKEEYDISFKQKEQASAIAELFALWGKRDENDKPKLNQLILEASMWLPDDILKEVFKRLTYQAGAKEVKEIVIDIRKHILQKTTDIKAGDIVHF